MKRFQIQFTKKNNIPFTAFRQEILGFDTSLALVGLICDVGRNIFENSRTIFCDGILATNKTETLEKYVIHNFEKCEFIESIQFTYDISSYLYDAEYCECNTLTQIRIAGDYILLSTPFHCLDCGNLVPVSRIFTDFLNYKNVYSWVKTFAFVEEIYINSDLYEDWADNELKNLKSAVNLQGINFAKEITQQQNISCFYTVPDNVLFTKKRKICPICHNKGDELQSTLAVNGLKPHLCSLCNICWYDDSN